MCLCCIVLIPLVVVISTTYILKLLWFAKSSKFHIEMNIALIELIYLCIFCIVCIVLFDWFMSLTIPTFVFMIFVLNDV